MPWLGMSPSVLPLHRYSTFQQRHMLTAWLLGVLVEEERGCRAGFVGGEPGAQKVVKIVLGCGSMGCAQ